MSEQKDSANPHVGRMNLDQAIWGFALLLMLLPSALAGMLLLVSDADAISRAPLPLALFFAATFYGVTEMFLFISNSKPLLRPLFTVLILVSAFLLAFITISHLPAKRRSSTISTEPLNAAPEAPIISPR